MRKVILLVMMTLDGFFDGPGGGPEKRCTLAVDPSGPHTVPVRVHFPEAQPGVERTRSSVIALDLQRSVSSAHPLRPGEDLTEQRRSIAPLAVLGSSHNIHKTERPGIDNP